MHVARVQSPSGKRIFRFSKALYAFLMTYNELLDFLNVVSLSLFFRYFILIFQISKKKKKKKKKIIGGEQKNK